MSSSKDTQPQPAAPGNSRRGAWIAAAVGAAVVLVVIVALVVGGGSLGGPGPTPSPSSSAAASPTPTASGTAVPEPTAGGETPPPEQPPVDFGDEATTETGVVVSVHDLTSIEGEAQGIGEIAGPAIRFTVTATNSTAAPVSLAATVVNLYSGAAGDPAGELAGNGSSPLPASVDPGATVTGVYVFSVPSDQRDAIRITVDYQAGSPVVVFEGRGPAA